MGVNGYGKSIEQRIYTMRRFLSVVVGLFISVSAYGQTLQQTPIGARPIGLGGAFVGISDDANAIFWNPAGIPLVQRQELRFTNVNNRYGIDLNDNNFSLIFPVRDNHAVGVDVFWNGFKDDELDFGKLMVRPSYGYRFKDLSLGVNGKFLRTTTNLDGTSIAITNGFGFDAGLLITLGERFRLGVVARDITETSATNEQDVSESLFKRSFVGGVSYKPTENALVALDIDDRAHFGVEYWVAPIFAVRGGLQKDLDTPENLSNSFNYALGTSIKYRFIQIDYAYDHHPILPATHYLTFSILRSPPFVSIKNAELRTATVMKSMYPYYQRKEFADVILKNAAQEPVDATVSIYVPNLMDTPYEERVSLPPQTIKSYPFKVTFSDTLLLASSAGFDNTVQPAVKVSYSQDNVQKQKEEKMRPVFIAGKNKMQWQDTRMAGAFVTIDDAAVERFARGMVATYGKLLRERFGNSNISKAMLLFDAIGTYGIRYQIDKSTPWAAVAGDSTAFDTIQYPGELFTSKIGDCDDLTVMFASLLGNLGIDTAFLEANDPGFPHIYLMFDSGIDLNSVADHFLDPSEYVIWREKVWIPVETTMFTAFSFIDAWRRGREEYHNLKPRGYIEETHVWEASQAYPPGKVKAGEIQLPSEQAINKLYFDRDVAEFDRRVEQIASLQAVSLEDADGLYDAGAYYMRIGRLDKALGMMDSVLKKDPAYSDAYNAKGVIYTKRRDYDKALESYNKALALMPQETGIRMNIALLYYLKNEPEKVKEEAKRLEGTGYEEVVKDYVKGEKVPERKIEIKK